MAEFVTLDDLKKHLNMSSTNDDDELSGVLSAAEDVVEGIVGRLRVGEVSETHYNVTSPVLILRRVPVGELVSVSTQPFAGWGATERPASDFVLDADAGLLRTASGYRFGGDVTVTYSTGYDAIPAAVKLATLIVAAHLWETQRGTSPSALTLQQADIDPSAPIGAGFAVPNRARELLAPYVRAGQIG